MKKFRGASFGLVIASLGLGLPTGASAAGCFGPSTNAKYCQQAPGSYELAYDATASNGIRLDALKSGILFKSYLPPKFLGNSSATTAFFIPQATRAEFESFLNNKPTAITINDAVAPGTVTLSAANCPGGSDLSWTLKATTGINGSVLTVPTTTSSQPPSRIIVDGYTLNDGTSLSIGTTAMGSKIEWSASRTEKATDGTIQETKFIQDQQITFAPTSLKSAGWCWTASGLTNNCTNANADGYYWSGTKPSLIPAAAAFPTANPTPNTGFYYSINNGAWQTGDCSSKTPKNGQCGAAETAIFTKLSDVQARNDLCSVGSPQNIRDAGAGIYKWNCTGVNGGTTSVDCVSSSSCWTCGSGELFGLGCSPTTAQLSNMCGTEAVGYMYDLYEVSNAHVSYDKNSQGYQEAFVDPTTITASTQIPGIKLFLSKLNLGTTIGEYKNVGGANYLYPAAIDTYKSQYQSSSLGQHQLTSADWFGVCYDATWKPSTAEKYVFVAQADDMVVLTINGSLIGAYGGGYVPGVSPIYAPAPPEKPNVATWPNTTFGFFNSGNDPTTYIFFPYLSQANMSTRNTRASALVSFSQNRIEPFYNALTVTTNSTTLKPNTYPVQIKYVQGYPTGMTLRMWAIPASKLSAMTGDAVRTFLSNATNYNSYFMNLSAPTSITCPHQTGQ